jgi:hypothetical protein
VGQNYRGQGVRRRGAKPAPPTLAYSSSLSFPLFALRKRVPQPAWQPIAGYDDPDKSCVIVLEHLFTWRGLAFIGTSRPSRRWAIVSGLGGKSHRETNVIRNGLYSMNTTVLDGVEGGAAGVTVIRDGKMLGGGPTFWHHGSYQCSDGKWKGEVMSQEHTPVVGGRPFEGHNTSIGFAGTYTDEDAEFEATALIGKRSIRLKTVFRLLVAD